MINDQYVIDNLFTKQGNVNTNCIKGSYLATHSELKEYLESRYSDSDSYAETIYRIKLGIETRPTCPVCGGKVSFDPQHRNMRGRNGNPFLVYCSSKCMANSDDVKKKKVRSCVERYGVDNPMKYEAAKTAHQESIVERYGVVNIGMCPEIKRKIKKMFIERYGGHPLSSPEVQEKIRRTSMIRYGVSAYSKTNDSKAKTYQTKKKNNSFHTSKKEDILYNRILSIYPDAIRQYKSKEYPHTCDFYIPSLSLYIELNGTWTHGPHPYGGESDAELLQRQAVIMKMRYGRGRYRTLPNSAMPLSIN